MYLSTLMVNVGDHPDRPRPGRLWLRNIYAVHQRLSMAFPFKARKDNDPQFLQPYRPEDFPLHNLGPHVSRNEQTGFLFRIDPRPADNPIIVVQSSLRPDWDYAFKNAPLLAAKPECRDYNPAFEKGQTWRFRILINLSHKAKQSQQGANLTRVRENDFDAHGRPKSQSKRVALTWDQNQNPEPVILNWFQKKAWVCPGAQAAPAQAFSLNHAKVIRLGWVVGWKNIYTQTQSLNHKMKFRSALIEGELEVQDPNAFHRLVAGGMGAAKAFGFGLLSLYPPSQATSPCPTPQPGKP